MKTWTAWIVMAPCAVLVSGGAAGAVDRPIALKPVVATSWEYVTPGTQVLPRPTLGVGFWQRASGAKPGVGANYVTSMEYQLPEAMPARIRSATFQFSGKPSQCVGVEPVVIDVYAYAGDGRADVADSTAGARVAQLRADCATNPAFTQPIDVTSIVRQLAVPAGVRHVGLNIRKANNRQGPGLFALSPGMLTVVVADQEVAQRPAQTTLPSPSIPPIATVAVRDLRGEYSYLGRGVATVAQNGTDVLVRATWTPMGAGPHYEARGKLNGDTIVGQWYSLYHKKGWFRWVAHVHPNGDIDFARSDDPINVQLQRAVLTRTGAPSTTMLPPGGFTPQRR